MFDSPVTFAASLTTGSNLLLILIQRYALPLFGLVGSQWFLNLSTRSSSSRFLNGLTNCAGKFLLSNILEKNSLAQSTSSFIVATGCVCMFFVVGLIYSVLRFFLEFISLRYDCIQLPSSHETIPMCTFGRVPNAFYSGQDNCVVSIFHIISHVRPIRSSVCLARILDTVIHYVIPAIVSRSTSVLCSNSQGSGINNAVEASIHVVLGMAPYYAAIWCYKSICFQI